MNPLFLAIMASARGNGIDKGVWKGKNITQDPPSRYCTAVAISSNGGYMYAAYAFTGDSYGYLYRSTDSGVTWSLVYKIGDRIKTLNCSDSGQYLIAICAGVIVVFSSYGTAAGAGIYYEARINWVSAAISPDGSRITASHLSLTSGSYTYPSQVYSTDYGTTWSPYVLSSTTDETIDAVYITGTNFFAVSSLGKLYKNGSLVGWTGSLDAASASISVRGTKVIAANRGGTPNYLKVSSGSGEFGTFSDLTTMPQKIYRMSAISQDGSTIVAITDTFEIIISRDAGATYSTDTAFVGSSYSLSVPGVIGTGDKIMVGAGYTYGNF